MEVLSKPKLVNAFIYSVMAGTGLALGYATLSSSYVLCTAIGGGALILVGTIGAIKSIRNPREIRNATIDDIAETPVLHYKVKCEKCDDEHDQALPINYNRNLEVIALEGVVTKSKNSILDDNSKITITDGKKSIDCHLHYSPVIMPNDKVTVTGYLMNDDKSSFIDVYHIDYTRSKKAKNRQSKRF